ncbi:formylglycine-generating enzyme family protein [Paenibacillus sp. N1-5-1-14]|nr:formylglycine-generating enzyme family protein [Paenibacillus radicibacter]MCR8644269.1 formylglycine-generating enzyme family protein [Paenibacillus radicibacter]
MIHIPKGEESMRDDRKKTQWKVEVQPFQLGIFPVTRGLYNSLMGESAVNTDEIDKPQVNISWQDAIAFCNHFSRKMGLTVCYSISDDGRTVTCDWGADGYRLPTEAEWQYACKAGTTSYVYGELDRIAWYDENSGGSAHEVGGKEPNPWGLYDMLGNVWEWCWDVYDKEVYGTYRVFRGGSWAEQSRGCGSTCRRRSHPTFAIDDLGFRLARSI